MHFVNFPYTHFTTYDILVVSAQRRHSVDGSLLFGGKPHEEVDTPGAATIEEITEFLKLPASKFAKTVLFL